MILGLREKLKRSRRLRLATLATLILALLALPCGPFAEALGSNTGHVVAEVTAANPGHSHTDGTHHANENGGNCCADCSVWLTARFDDGNAAIITHNWSRGDLLSVERNDFSALHLNSM